MQLKYCVRFKSVSIFYYNSIQFKPFIYNRLVIENKNIFIKLNNQIRLKSHSKGRENSQFYIYIYISNKY